MNAVFKNKPTRPSEQLVLVTRSLTLSGCW